MPARMLCSTALFTVLLCVPLLASAAPTEYRVLFDVDADAATGCLVDGVAGIDQLLATEVSSDDSTAAVVRTFRRVCAAGTMGEPLDVNATGWPAVLDGASGNITVETRAPFLAFGPAMPMRMRIAFAATQGSTVRTLLTGPAGEQLVFPDTAPGRRRAIGIGGERLMVLDGQLDDWGVIDAMAVREPGAGDLGFQLARGWAFAHSAQEGHFYFAFRARLSGGAEPVANDDHYERNEGQPLTVPFSTGVLTNDVEPNGGALTATKVTDPSHGTVTLNPDGSFEYTPASESSVAADQFSYRATNGAAGRTRQESRSG